MSSFKFGIKSILFDINILFQISGNQGSKLALDHLRIILIGIHVAPSALIFRMSKIQSKSRANFTLKITFSRKFSKSHFVTFTYLDYMI